MNVRVKTLLDDIFSTDGNTFISLTGHGGLFPTLLSVVGYPNLKFNLTTGQAVPILVKVVKVEGTEAPTTPAPPAAAKTCGPCGP